jgi:hypothetical protein
MQHDWSEGRTKEKGGAEKEERAEKMNVKKIKEGLIRQDKRRKAACEDQKND